MRMRCTDIYRPLSQITRIYCYLKISLGRYIFQKITSERLSLSETCRMRVRCTDIYRPLS
ncbi:hypothetical protein [European catfish virus]|uniref:Uncharacterized protein n=1 Tax=European catfish virus TaxID=84739 RepID=I2BFI5_9VIRU|nr:hypothetical protein A190_gp011 [European catfish virus]AFJ52288.1 hypothetical protein [European catfish virus]AMZ04835.1 hypothetical protein [European catfish virus]AMZ04970.1 hypothetical protein [European catfish virus]